MKKHLLITAFIITGLYSTTTLVAQVTANQPSDIHVCDDLGEDNDGFTVFDLTINVPEIIGTQDPTNLVVTFYETPADANNATNTIVNPESYINAANPQTIFVRIEDFTNGDYDTTSFVIWVHPNPTPNNPDSLIVCDVTNSNDGQEVFDLTVRAAQILNGASWGLTYHESYSEAVDNIGIINNPFAYANVSNPQIIYVRVTIDSADPDSCFEIVELELTVNPTPETNPVSPLVVFDVNGDGFEIFDLTSKIPEILNGQAADVTFYETQLDADAGLNAIGNPGAYTNFYNPQTIYTRLQNIITGCYAVTDFELIANPNLGLEDDYFTGLSISPNPSTSIINVQSNNLTETVAIAIYNLQGQVLLSESKTPENGTISFNVSNLPTGVYFIKIATEGVSVIKRIVKL